jgi:hypothetical protein
MARMMNWPRIVRAAIAEHHASGHVLQLQDGRPSGAEQASFTAILSECVPSTRPTPSDGQQDQAIRRRRH